MALFVITICLMVGLTVAQQKPAAVQQATTLPNSPTPGSMSRQLQQIASRLNIMQTAIRDITVQFNRLTGSRDSTASKNKVNEGPVAALPSRINTFGTEATPTAPAGNGTTSSVSGLLPTNLDLTGTLRRAIAELMRQIDGMRTSLVQLSSQVSAAIVNGTRRVIGSNRNNTSQAGASNGKNATTDQLYNISEQTETRVRRQAPNAFDILSNTIESIVIQLNQLSQQAQQLATRLGTTIQNQVNQTTTTIGNAVQTGTAQLGQAVQNGAAQIGAVVQNSAQSLGQAASNTINRLTG